MDVRTDLIEEIRMARVRHVGPYDGIGACFNRLFAWVAATDVPYGRVFTLSHDDPDVVARENLRSDACLELHADAEAPDGIVVETLPAGRYAVHTHKGPYELLANSYRRLFTEWLPASGEAPELDRPCMEIYRNSPADAAPDELLTDICIPLRQLTGKPGTGSD